MQISTDKYKRAAMLEAKRLYYEERYQDSHSRVLSTLYDSQYPFLPLDDKMP